MMLRYESKELIRAKEIVHSMVAASKRKRRKVPYDVNLTIDVVHQMLTKNHTCQMCEKPFDYTTKHTKPVLDQIEPRKGHIMDNVGVICGTCNYRKGPYNLKYYTKCMESLVKYHGAAPNVTPQNFLKSYYMEHYYNYLAWRYMRRHLGLSADLSTDLSVVSR